MLKHNSFLKSLIVAGIFLSNRCSVFTDSREKYLSLYLLKTQTNPKLESIKYFLSYHIQGKNLHRKHINHNIDISREHWPTYWIEKEWSAAPHQFLLIVYFLGIKLWHDQILSFYIILLSIKLETLVFVLTCVKCNKYFIWLSIMLILH